MNSEMTTNSQLSTTKPEKTKTKQTSRRGTESHGGLSVGRGRGGKVTRNKKHKWQVQNRQGGG